MEFPQNYRARMVKLASATVFLGILAFFNQLWALELLHGLFLFAIAFLIFDFLGVKSRLFFIIFTAALFFNIGSMMIFSYQSTLTLSDAMVLVFNAWLLSLIVMLLYVTLLEVGVSRLGASAVTIVAMVGTGLFFSSEIVAFQVRLLFLVMLLLLMAIKLIKKYFRPAQQ